MEDKIAHFDTILLVGSGNLTWTVAVCLLQAGHTVDLWTNEMGEAANAVHAHLSEMNAGNGELVSAKERLIVSAHLKELDKGRIAIVVTHEDLTEKQRVLKQLEEKLSPDAIIGINAESIGLDLIQQHCKRPERIMGMNWVDPAHTTRFLELIINNAVDESVCDQIVSLAQSGWEKDPYIVRNFGIRSRLLCAMVREAFYLVENGYASVEDIDRACRNDAGYYLPFSGNCRYMDLMGTYAYGMVMRDLNPELSKKQEPPDFFKDILKTGGVGMENRRGMYHYTREEVRIWKEAIRKFSYQIEKIINKYPFNYRT